MAGCPLGPIWPRGRRIAGFFLGGSLTPSATIVIDGWQLIVCTAHPSTKRVDRPAAHLVSSSGPGFIALANLSLAGVGTFHWIRQAHHRERGSFPRNTGTSTRSSFAGSGGSPAAPGVPTGRPPASARTRPRPRRADGSAVRSLPDKSESSTAVRRAAIKGLLFRETANIFQESGSTAVRRPGEFARN